VDKTGRRCEARKDGWERRSGPEKTGLGPDRRVRADVVQVNFIQPYNRYVRRSRNTMGLVEQTMTPDDLTLRTPGSREASLASDLEALQARADISPK
jgi:hypothetical protein